MASTMRRMERQVTPGYFQTLQATAAAWPVLPRAGRCIESPRHDHQPGVGAEVFSGRGSDWQRDSVCASEPVIEIVGMVDDFKEGPLDEEIQPAIYTPFDQSAGQLSALSCAQDRNRRLCLQRLVATFTISILQS